MVYADLTRYEKRRFRNNPTCPICSFMIFDDEQLIFIKKSSGRRTFYKFYHRRCFEWQKSQTSVLAKLSEHNDSNVQ